MSEEEKYQLMVENAEAEFKEEVNSKLHNKFPRFLKDFLNDFVKTKFFQKPYKLRKEWIDVYEYKVEDFFIVDWECPTLSPYKEHTDEKLISAILTVGVFGEIPHYQHDELKIIVIDFKNKEAYLERGLAIKPYARYVLKHKLKIPNYMQPLINKLWADYDDYITNKESE